MQRCNGIGKRKSPPYRFLMIGQTKSRGPVSIRHAAVARFRLSRN
jgi:hypothetical protein